MTILRLTYNDDYSTDEVVSTIQTDPALTSQLLRMANTGEAASVEEIATLEQATMRLGSKAVRNVALGFALLSDNRVGNCEEFDYDEYWARSVFVAVAAQRFAATVPRVCPAEAFVCGLLSGLGSLALASIHSDKYGEILTECRGRPDSELARAERAAFEITHGEVARAMLLEWGLPDRVADAAATHAERRDDGEIDDLKSAVWGAAVLARFYVSPSEMRPRLLREVDLLKAALGMTDDAFLGLAEEITEAWRDMAVFLEVPRSVDERFSDAYSGAGEHSLA